jgi:hypothetical protein
MTDINEILKSRSRRESGQEANLSFLPGKTIYTTTEENANEFGIRRRNGVVSENGFEGDRITNFTLKDPNTDVGATWIELSKKLYALQQSNAAPTTERKPFDPNLPPGPDNVYSPLDGAKPPINIDKNSLVGQKIKPPETDEEFAEWGLNHIGHLEYNLTAFGMKTLETGMSDDPDLALALHTMFSMYDELPMFTKEGTARAVSGLISDPFTYIGLGTLGAGTVAKMAVGGMTKAGMKKGLRETIKKNYGNDILLAIEGGLYTGSYDAFRQSISMKSGEQDQYNVGQTGTMAATGAVLGPAIGRAVKHGPQAVGAGLRKGRDMISRADEKTRAEDQGSTVLRSGVRPGDVAVALDDALPGKEPTVDQDNLGFYSKALETSKALKQEKGSGEQFRGMLTKAGVKDDEMLWTGLDDVLSKDKVTKQEIIDHLENNRVELEEIELPGRVEGEVETLNFDEGEVIDDYSAYSHRVDDILYDLERADELFVPQVIETLGTLHNNTSIGNNVTGEALDDLFIGNELNPKVVEALKNGEFSYKNDDGLNVNFQSEVTDAVDAIAREEYLNNPEMIYRDYGGSGYEIYGNDDIGYAFSRNGERISTDFIGNFNEARVQAENHAYQEGVIGYDAGEGMAMFEDHMQPGGENYRELLLKLPNYKGDPLLPEIEASIDNLEKRRSKLITDLTQDGTVNNPKALDSNNPELKELTDQTKALVRKRDAIGADTSGHHGEENIPVHVLMKDRQTDGGDRVLYAEEIQSDWSQAGQARKGKGKFMSETFDEEQAAVNTRYQKLRKDYLALTNEVREVIGKIKPEIMPIDNVELERMLQMGGIPRGMTSNDIELIFNTLQSGSNSNRDFRTEAMNIREEVNLLTNEYTKKPIPRGPFVGTSDKFLDLALKRLIRYAADNNYDYISWANGDVVASRWNEPGLKEIYDRNIPNQSNKLLKKLDKGQKVETIKIPMDSEGLKDHLAIRITPKIKTSAKAGQPLFSIGAGAAGAVAATQGGEDGR